MLNSVASSHAPLLLFPPRHKSETNQPTSSLASMRLRMGRVMAQWFTAPNKSWEKSVERRVKIRSGCACKCDRSACMGGRSLALFCSESDGCIVYVGGCECHVYAETWTNVCARM